LPDRLRTDLQRLLAEEEHLARLAERLLAFHRDGVPAAFPPPSFAGECTPPLADAFAFFRGAVDAWHAAPESPDVACRFADAIAAAGSASLLLLLGQRRTSASVTDARAIPPTRARLLAAATRLHGPADPLTVAARALTKHVHRSPLAFWGEVRGTAEEKNALALRHLDTILDGTTWWNVFGHFKHELVYEARLPSGHGARWGKLGDEFVGFLEPFDDRKGVAMT
jgi:hypothetical protein